MKHPYQLGGLWRQAWLLLLLALAMPRAWAQTATTIYYTLGSSTATLDALASAAAAGGTGTPLASGSANFSQPTDVALDKANSYLYVADQYVGTGGIYRYTTGGTGRTLVVAGLPGTTYNGLAFDAANNKLYFTQAGATAANAALKVVSLGGTLPATASSVATLPATFTRPGDLALDATAGALYVADQHTAGSIIKVIISSGAVTTPVAGVANATYNGLALDATNGRLYFTQGSTDPTLDALKLLTLSTSAVTTLASGSANFSQPSDLAFEPGAAGSAGQLYLADQYVTTGPLLRYTLSVGGGVVSAGGRTSLVAATAGAAYSGLALLLVNPTAAPVVTTPANGSLLNTRTPTYVGTAVANATITVYVDGTALSATTTATAGGAFTLTQPTALADGSHTVYATAQSSGATVSANSNTNTFTIDATAPTVAITSSAGASGSGTGTSPLPFTVTFSEAVTGFVAGDVTVTNGAISAFAGSGTTYTFNVTPAANGAVTVNVPANVAQDAAGNGNTAAPSTYTLTYTQPVTAAPVVIVPSNGSLNATTTPTYAGTAPANSTVTVYVDGSALPTYAGTAPANSLVTVYVDGTALASTVTANNAGNWAISQPTALAQGSHTVYATAQTSGSAVSANSNTNTFTIDTVRPSVAISSSAGASGSGTGTSPLPFTVTFSEAVTGFVAGDVTVTNGTISGFAGSGTTYTFNVTPTTAGTATTVSVPANVAQDQAGNGNTAAPSTYALTYSPTLVTWTGAVSSDWFTAGNWSPAVVPTAGTSALIPAGVPNYPAITAGTANVRALTLNSGATLSQSGGTLNLAGDLTNNGTLTATGGTVALGSTTPGTLLGSSDTRFWNLTVQANGAQLSTSASTSVQRVLTLTGNLTTNSNPLTLLSGASGDALVVNNGGVVTGSVAVQRYIDPSLNTGLGYRHYSAPVGNTTVADLATSGFTPVVNPTYNTSTTPSSERPFPTVYGYDQSRVSLNNTSTPFDRGFFSPAALSDPLPAGQGYAVNLGASELVDFTGPLNNGALTLSLASNRNTYPDGGWQLVGNPYPAPLDYSRVASVDRLNLEGAVYVYSSTSQYNGQYRVYINGVGGNPVLPSSQGFFVRVAAGQASGTLTFRNSQRLTTPNATAFQRTAETRPLVQLTLKGAGSLASDDAYVYFEQGATASFDAQYDAVKLPNTTGLNVSSVGTPDNLSINGLPVLGTTVRTVPLALGVPAPGTYTFTASQLLNLTATPVYLRDLLTGTVVDLHQQPAYSFTVSNASALITTRFELVFSPAQPLATAAQFSAASVSVYPNPAHAQFTLALPGVSGASQAQVGLYNVLGQAVRETTLALPATGTQATLDVLGLPEGMYVLRIKAGTTTVTKPVTIN